MANEVAAKPRVYIETTIPSYLTAWPSRGVLLLGRQRATRDWWEHCRGDYELFISQVVLDECGNGDSEAAAARLQCVAGLPRLAYSPPALLLAQDLLAGLKLPQRAANDAAHLAIAAVHGVEYLLTWNCRHLANAALEKPIAEICGEHGRSPPIVRTPEQLMGERDADARG